jgi:CheY-specific phosphatase CheX
MWNSRPIESITTEEIRHLVKMKLADRKPSQQKNVLKYIRGTFNFAVETGILTRNLTKSGEDRVIDIAPPLMTLSRELKIKNKESVFVLPRIQDWDVGRQAEILQFKSPSL